MVEKKSDPYLFASKENRYTTAEWFDEMSKNQAAYADCSVVTFTRVKNLASKYMHEYVQFIVEDSKTRERARVYSERGVMLPSGDIIDAVNVGRKEVGFDQWPELPLPLTSLTFAKDQGPSVLNIADILKAVTTVGGKYEYYGNNCFWFAATTYRIVKAKFSATEKQWSWMNAGGDGGMTIKGAYGIGFPTLFKFAFKPTASKFKVERESNFNWLVSGGQRSTVTPEEFTEAIVSVLKEKPVMNEYLEAMHMHGVDIKAADVETVASSVQRSATEVSKQEEITWTEDFDQDVRNFSDKTLADPNAEDFEKYYEQKKLANAPKNEQGQIIIEPRDDYFGPGSNEYQRMERSMDVFAGCVLKMLDGSA